MQFGLLDAGNHGSTEDAITEALALDPESKEALLRADMHERKVNFGKALLTQDKLVEALPSASSEKDDSIF